MAHTDRQPTSEVFNDIVQAARKTWINGDYHEDYIQGQMEYIDCLADQNFADNWYSFIGRMDVKNQMVFWHCIQYKETEDFLRTMYVHYGYFIPKIKKSLTDS